MNLIGTILTIFFLLLNYYSTYAYLKFASEKKHATNYTKLVKHNNLKMLSKSENVNLQLQPNWVSLINKSLENFPISTLVSFVFIDISTASFLWYIYELIKFQVDLEFTSAYALSKLIRIHRLAIDAVGTNMLIKAVPSLELVNMSNLTNSIFNLLPYNR
jgi:hypothetical protein